MEWTMPVNEIFDEEVTKISATFLPKNFSGDVRTTRSVQEQIAKLIDTLGKESASSQGLNKVITSAEKLRSNPTHTIYLLKDHRACDAKGEIIGLLKVGRKHLFLFDDKQAVHEVEPLCVLDFYIVSDRQRKGFGRTLFDFMLHELEVTADQLAIDGPSDKMEQFLARNFGIKKLLRQNNNFAVARSFFDRSDYEISSRAGDATVAPAAAVGRFAAPKPTSAIANVIHGAHDEPARRSLPAAAAAPGTAAEALAAIQAAIAADADVEAAMADVAEARAAVAAMEAATAAKAAAEAAAKASAAAALPVDPYGIEDYEYPSSPELDDDEYERYSFDPDQPASERRDEMRARGNRYN